MKPVRILLLIFTFLNTNAQKFSTFPTDQAAPFDPYFVETRDTVSVHGPKCIVREVLQDRQGNYWLASWQGIIRYDGHYFTNVTLKEGLIHFHVAFLAGDRSGNLWFGTVRGGLYRYDGRSFTLFTTKDGLTDNSVVSMCEDRDGNIWFGTFHGASFYNGKTFTSFTKENGLSDNNVDAIIQDRTGKLWFGTKDGIFHYQLSGEKTSFIPFTDKSGLPFRNITSLLEDKNGSILVGKMDGLCRYDASGSGSFTDLMPGFTYYIISDKAGTVWLTASETNTSYSQVPRQVLYAYDGKKFTRIIEKSEPSDCQVFGKIADKNGHIWFGTMKGVCRYDGKTVSTFTE